MIRSLLTVLGLVLVFGIVAYGIKPDLYKQLTNTILSKPNAPESAGVLVKANARMSKFGMGAPNVYAKTSVALIDNITGPKGENLAARVIELQDEGLPARSAPYLLVINKANNQMKYVRLGQSVKSITPRMMAGGEIVFSEVPRSKDGPYQAILWVTNPTDVDLEIDVLVPETPPAPPAK